MFKPAAIAALITAMTLTACARDTQEDAPAPQLDDTTRLLLEQALRGEHRNEEHPARDHYRNPVETLAFFGLRHDMTVVEILPGGGWYTEILAPVLRDNGQLYAAHFPEDSDIAFYRRLRGMYEDKLNARPGVYDQVVITAMDFTGENTIAPPESADMVLTFRSVHGWLRDGTGEEAFAAMYRALKPGGVLGVVQHRAAEGMPPEAEQRNGYVHTQTVIDLAESAGLQLDATSEINANPRDTKDHPEGVWALPPTLRPGEQDREHYLTIGESDRMTLRFVKPE